MTESKIMLLLFFIGYDFRIAETYALAFIDVKYTIKLHLLLIRLLTKRCNILINSSEAPENRDHSDTLCYRIIRPSANYMIPIAEFG